MIDVDLSGISRKEKKAVREILGLKGVKLEKTGLFSDYIRLAPVKFEETDSSPGCNKEILDPDDSERPFYRGPMALVKADGFQVLGYDTLSVSNGSAITLQDQTYFVLGTIFPSDQTVPSQIAEGLETKVVKTGIQKEVVMDFYRTEQPFDFNLDGIRDNNVQTDNSGNTGVFYASCNHSAELKKIIGAVVNAGREYQRRLDNLVKLAAGS